MKPAWILCDEGKVGTYRQCLALAKILNIEAVHKPINLNAPYRWFPPQMMLWCKNPAKLQSVLSEPYPNLIIAAGRQAVNAALVLRRVCKTIVLQNPRIDPRYFDLVIPPYHDNVQGQNVISTLGALHPIRPEELAPLRHEHYQGPTVTVLIGGDSQHYRYTSTYIQTLGQTLRNLVTTPGPFHGAQLLITPSRRSRPELLLELKRILMGTDFEMWNNQGDNPYLRYLACADTVMVTGDSISMMSEACITGKPVYIHQIPTSSKRLSNFLTMLYENHHAAPLLEHPGNKLTFKPLDELKRVHGLISDRL
ncbi:mitochondrial fission ELM1 family protein [Candidatus Finniella inopinata]|uniref:Nucleoside-diphosphate sugar epimerase n=1 Tax=Candidatus Finniella inopinata TaxID=1696036 RepID=A0A4Q7DIB5_9PROT|nr:mitochondrial fission ELM1 family protein [Candidatus Finniella inopinata]RZI45704.1 hypothetical protein EQU50_06280 [Candidatus Finniella inopinata]